MFCSLSPSLQPTPPTEMMMCGESYFRYSDKKRDRTSVLGKIIVLSERQIDICTKMT